MSVLLRSLIFWVVTQLMLVVIYQHFGTAYWSCLQGSSSPRSSGVWFQFPDSFTGILLRLFGPWSWDR